MDFYNNMFKSWEKKKKPIPRKNIIKKQNDDTHKKPEQKKSITTRDFENFARYDYKNIIKEQGLAMGLFVSDIEACLRAEFFFAIERVVPETLKSLANDVFPIYLNVFPRIVSSNLVKEPPCELEKIGNTERERYFQDILQQWGIKWNLTADWSLGLSLMIMREWVDKPHWKGMIFRLPLTLRGMPRDAGFNISWEPWAEREKAFDQRLSHEIKKYKKKIKVLYKEMGWKEILKRRARSGHRLLHLEWLALYQVGKWSHDRIAQRDSVTRESVSKGIRKAAEKLGIALRPPGKSGRPRKEEK